MQEEITKHTKKIFKTAKSTNHSFGEKVKEILIEIFIIVFAVTLSIWLHSWSEHKHQQKEVSLFFSNLKNDLKNDIETLKLERDEYIKANKGYEFILGLTQFQLDSLDKSKNSFFFPVHSQGKKINIGNFEGFKSSGKIGYIENEELKQKILSYYQKTVPSIDEVDKGYNDFIFKAFDQMIANASKTDKELYTDPKFKKTVFFLVALGNNNVRVYNEMGIKNASDLIGEIEKAEK